MTATTPSRSEEALDSGTHGAHLHGAKRAQAGRTASVVAWIGLLACAAVAFELTCRIEDWVMYRMPVTSPYASVEDLLVHDADGVHGRRNAQFEKWVMNNVGTRGPDVPVIPPAGTIRIVTVGASETFGLRESPDHEFPRQLEDSLNTRFSRVECNESGTSRGRFEVLNAAFAGMTAPTIEQDLRNRISRLHPAIIVAYVSPSAYLEEQRPVAAKPDSSGRAESLSIRRVLYPRALGRLRDQLKSMLPQFLLAWVRKAAIGAANRGHSADWQFTSVPAERLSNFDADLRGLVGVVRSIGATPVLVTHANLFAGRSIADSAQLLAWGRFAPRATGPTLIAFDSLARIATLRVAADSAVTVVDAAAQLAAAPPQAFADYMHFTDLGAALMAGAAANGVLNLPSVAQCRAR